MYAFSRAIALFSLVAVATATVTISTSRPALAEPAMLAKARKLYKDLEYRSAADLLQRLLGQSGLDRASRIEVYKLLGLCKAILNRPAEAKAAFSALLDLDPAYELDAMTTPRALDVFRQVKAQRQAQAKTKVEVRPISLSHVAPVRAEPGLPLSLTVAVQDPKQLTRSVRLHHRRIGASGFETVVAQKTRGTSYEARIVGPKVLAPRIEYYFEALGEGDKVLATVGQASLPLRIAVEKEKVVATPTPLYKKWWFWTIIGAVAAGATAGIVVGVTQSGGDTPPTPPTPTVDVNVSFTN